jgi:hypothetical protein
MKKTTSLMFLFLVVVLVACKTKQVSNSTAIDNETSVAFNKTLIVEFYSKGAGINHPAFSKMKSLVDKPKEEQLCQFENTLIKYGREGERQYCMSFDDKKCYLLMLQAIKENIRIESNVRIIENGTCHRSAR